jgi:hypothetical protein
MRLNFDERGNYKPYGRSELNLNQFREIFVDAFNEDSSRHVIYNEFEKYVTEFSSEVSPQFIIWINGSFVTNKLNPQDIDIVILLNHKIAMERTNILQEKFLNRSLLRAFKIDAYIVRLFPAEHKEYIKTRSDLLYWEHWFSNSRMNSAKKRFPKGFIELSFDNK